MPKEDKKGKVKKAKIEAHDNEHTEIHTQGAGHKTITYEKIPQSSILNPFAPPIERQTIETYTPPQQDITYDHNKSLEVSVESSEIQKDKELKKVVSRHKKNAVKQTPTEDALIIASDTKAQDAKDVDTKGLEALNDDTKQLFDAVSGLRKALSKYGPLHVAANLKVKGAENFEALKSLIELDYRGKQEASITLDYTDHRGKNFNEGLASVPITHENIPVIAAALKKATDEVSKMAQGATVQLDEVTAKVTKTLRTEIDKMMK